jgi:VWFA-related protein
MRLGRSAAAALVASSIWSAPAAAAGQSAGSHPQSAIPDPQSAGLDSQSAARNPQSPVRNPPAATARLFTIDVTAADARGRSVDDLKPVDFELRAEGAVVPLAAVRLVRAGTPSSEEAGAIESAADERQAASKDDARLFAIFLDEYHVGRDGTARAREALLQFVDRDLTPRDLVAVMKPLDSLFAIRLTRDRAAIRRAIEGFDGRKGQYEPRNAYERDYIAGTPARIDTVRNQVALSAINALAVHLGSLADRRKTLVVVTEGIGRADRRRGQEYLPTLETVIRSANRANVSVYPFDPGGGSDEPARDGLRRLAEETGGAPIDADPAAGLKRAAADSSVYYLLSFNAVHPDDGRFRALEARVTRPGVRLRAPKGYWAASPDEALRTALLAKSNEPKKAAPLEPALHVSALIRPWFGVSRGAGGASRVTFVWEPAARVPGDRVRRQVSRLVLTARAADGSILFEGPVTPTGAGAMDEPGATPSRAVFDAPPGRVRLRMSIQDAASQVLDQDVRELSVRDLRGEVAIGSLQVLRARNAREFRALDVEAAVPVASREFSRAERLLIRFQAYGPGGAPPVVTARLLGRSGQPLRDLTVAPSSAGDNTIDLPLAGLAAGEYSVEVTAAGTGRGDAKDRVGFRVTS